LPSVLVGVLVLARPSAREDGTSKNQEEEPVFSLGKPAGNIGSPRIRRDRTATAVSNKWVNEASTTKPQELKDDEPKHSELKGWRA